MATKKQTIYLLSMIAILPRVGRAAAEDLQIGAIALAAGPSKANTAYSMAGGGVTVSYSPWWHYVIDARVSCLVGRKRLEEAIGTLDSESVTERFRRSECDLVAGMSYRTGYPFGLSSPTRFGVVLGVGLGYRMVSRYDRTSSLGETRGKSMPADVEWLPIVSSRIGIEYRPEDAFSTGLYFYATSRSLSLRRTEIETAMGFLMSWFFVT